MVWLGCVLRLPKALRFRRARKKESIVLQPDFFVVWDRVLGRAEFAVKAGTDGGVPVEEAASLLAMRCLIRGKQPEDFELLVGSSDHTAFQGVFSRALSLLKTCQPAGPAGRLSRREVEVLTGLVNNLANKEIAGRLNISESTVKFHVSNLLAKFGVARRNELMHAAFLSRPSWQIDDAALLAGGNGQSGSHRAGLAEDPPECRAIPDGHVN